MNKAYVFTVIGDKDGTMSTLYAGMASIKMKNEQPVAVKAISDWIEDNAPDIITVGDPLDDVADYGVVSNLAYKMRKTGVAWHNNQYGFCLTELVG